MGAPPRVALFSDSFHEINGLALTARAFDAYARRRGVPFLSIRGSAADTGPSADSGNALDLKRSRLAVPLDMGLSFDPLWPRHVRRVRALLTRFRPDIVHLTGINDMGQLGAWLAHERRIPVVASWHTNVHEFAARRIERLLRLCPADVRGAIARGVERAVWQGLIRFYRIPRAILAPTDVLVRTLGAATGRPAFLMRRGIDTETFSPVRRTRADAPAPFRLGYVGRLAPEKNVAVLAEVEQRLIDAGTTGFEILIVGDGSERRRLQQSMRAATFTGVLRGEALARAYADIDAFVFPSETDTFGNVVLEALASGVPVIVTDKGGPQSQIRSGVEGFVVRDAGGMADAVRQLMQDRLLHARMRDAARRRAHDFSWEAVFDGVYDLYARVTDAAATPSPPRHPIAPASASPAP